MRFVPLAALSMLNKMTRTLDDGALKSRSAFVLLITFLGKYELGAECRMTKAMEEQYPSTKTDSISLFFKKLRTIRKKETFYDSNEPCKEVRGVREMSST